jgi:hypothetical protein
MRSLSANIRNEVGKLYAGFSTERGLTKTLFALSRAATVKASDFLKVES